LVEIEILVIFGEGASRLRGIGGNPLITAFITGGSTGATLEREGIPFVGVADARHETRKEVAVVVVDGGSGAGETEVGVLTCVSETGVVFALEAFADVYTDIPRGEIRI
jgi:hypothetical protein